LRPPRNLCSGARSKLNLAFVGLNPSISRNELIPTASPEWDFERYDRYYRQRFDKVNRDRAGKLCIKNNEGVMAPVRLWNNIEKFGKDYLKEVAGDKFMLGEHAILLEAIRYKSTKGWVGKTRDDRNKIFQHQSEFTQCLVNEGVFSTLVPMGNGALNHIRRMLDFDKEVPKQIMKAMGNSYVGRTRAGCKVTVCPIKHMSYPATRDKREEVSQEIIKAVRSIS